MGYTLIILLYLGWFEYGFPLAVMLILSGVTMVYVLFQAPVPCSARNRDGVTFCRNNAYGLLRGCNQVRQHKWQNAMMLIRREKWSDLRRTIFNSVAGNAAALSAMAAMVSAAAASIGLVIG